MRYTIKKVRVKLKSFEKETSAFFRNCLIKSWKLISFIVELLEEGKKYTFKAIILSGPSIAIFSIYYFSDEFQCFEIFQRIFKRKEEKKNTFF